MDTMDHLAGVKRHRDRKHCEHCGEDLSYSAHLQHRTLYYVASERRCVRMSDGPMAGGGSKWLRTQSDSSTAEGSTLGQTRES